ncbi:uncharacterized protein [Lepeophtheirus salmonis]|uniref:uncharacterized protein n=1 Tax=Lepeophtheirus salmonis TaxID=72036 RepID=UPI001AE21C85|nr:uncharacterized protein LOC121129709 [Lepeophtheirus salmonis]
MKILIVLGLLLGSSLASGYQHPLHSYPGPFYPSHLTPQSEFYTSRHPLPHSNSYPVPHQFHQSNSHPVPYPVPIQTSTPVPIIIATPVPVFITPNSLFNSQRDIFSRGSSDIGTNIKSAQFGNSFLIGKVQSTSSTRTPTRLDNKSSNRFPNNQIVTSYSRS